MFKVADTKFAVLVPNLYNIPFIPISLATLNPLVSALSSCTLKASTFVRPNKVSEIIFLSALRKFWDLEMTTFFVQNDKKVFTKMTRSRAREKKKQKNPA